MCTIILYTKDDSATGEHVISPFIFLDVDLLTVTLCFAIEILVSISLLPWPIAGEVGQFTKASATIFLEIVNYLFYLFMHLKQWSRGIRLYLYP